MRDLDIDCEEFVNPDFEKSIKGITSDIIVKKIKYPNPLHTFKFNCKLKKIQINTARFMMEGMGFSPKYWLCTGINTLDSILQYNISEGHYNELTKTSGRKDVLCLFGLPLFYSVEHTLGDCLLLVSDIEKDQVRISCFIDSSLITTKIKKKVAKKKVAKKKVAKKKATKKKQIKIGTHAPWDADGNDWSGTTVYSDEVDWGVDDPPF